MLEIVPSSMRFYYGKFEYDLSDFVYEGEVDEFNKPHGFGVAKKKNFKIRGFWLRGLMHGLCK